MKANLDVKEKSSEEWLQCVLEDFDKFLQDHADCERKASSMAMSFVAKFPDRHEILAELIDTAVEELEHFRSVYQLMQERNVPLPKQMAEDPYVKKLLKYCRSDREERFMDRLLLASVIETRGAERFKLIADNLEDGEMKKFYKELWTSEAKHGHIFVKMALEYFPEEDVYERLEELISVESDVLRSLEIRPALH